MNGLLEWLSFGQPLTAPPHRGGSNTAEPFCSRLAAPSELVAAGISSSFRHYRQYLTSRSSSFALAELPGTLHVWCEWRVSRCVAKETCSLGPGCLEQTSLHPVPSGKLHQQSPFLSNSHFSIGCMHDRQATMAITVTGVAADWQTDGRRQAVLAVLTLDSPFRHTQAGGRICSHSTPC